MTKREVSSEDIANMLRIELSHAAIDLFGGYYKERVHNQYTGGLMSVISIFGEKKVLLWFCFVFLRIKLCKSSISKGINAFWCALFLFLELLVFFCSLFSNICSLNTLNINNSITILITILSGELFIGGEWFESEFFFRLIVHLLTHSLTFASNMRSLIQFLAFLAFLVT